MLLLGLLFSQFIVLSNFNLVDFDLFSFYFYSLGACLFIMKDKKDVVSKKMRELMRGNHTQNIFYEKKLFQQKKEVKRDKPEIVYSKRIWAN